MTAILTGITEVGSELYFFNVMLREHGLHHSLDKWRSPSAASGAYEKTTIPPFIKRVTGSSTPFLTLCR